VTIPNNCIGNYTHGTDNRRMMSGDIETNTVLGC
jgi:hypothetical protein